MAARKDHRKQGCIDAAGHAVIPFRYFDAGSFHEGRAGVCVKPPFGISEHS
ncbi:MAG: WG repeat-containing protein [Phycisphaerales bacterium]